MKITIIPKIFYERMDDGLDLFIGTLGFTLRHRDEALAVVEREGAKVHLLEDAFYAACGRPEISIETDALDELLAEVSAHRPERLHPNASAIAARPWGAREFAVLDTTGVCVVLRQW